MQAHICRFRLLIRKGHMRIAEIAQGDYDGARPHYERALAIATMRLGAEHPHTQIYRRNLERLIREMGGKGG